MRNPKVMYRCLPQESIGSAVYHKIIRVKDVGEDDLVMCVSTSCDSGDTMTSGNAEVVAVRGSFLLSHYAATTDEADALYEKEVKQIDENLKESPF